MRSAAAAAILLASAPAHAGEDDPFDGGTITAQVGVGGLSGLIAGGTLGLIGAGVGHLINSHNIGTPIAGALLGFATGAAVGTIWGVDHVGDGRGANGTVLGTSVGFVVGASAWVGLQVLVARATHDELPGAALVATALVLCVGGAVVGYHLTADDPDQPRLSTPSVGFAF